MSDARKREIICSLFLIVKDILKLFIQGLIAAILISVCMENGWIFREEMITREIFWKLYKSILAVVPLIVFLRGVMGLYKVDIVEDEDISPNKAEQCRFKVIK